MADVIVPTKAISHLQTLLAKHDSEVTVALAKDRALFVIGRLRLLTKLIDGTFPDYTRVIPTEHKLTITLARQQLIDPPTAVAAIVNAEGDKVRGRSVAFDLGAEGGPEVQAKDTSGNQASEPIELTLAGEPIRFRVNQRYLAQVAGIFAADATMTLSMHGPRDAIRMTSDKDADLTAVVMPMNA